MILVKCSVSRPTHPVKGPGRTGKKEPMIPSVTKKKPKKSKKISMYYVCFVVSYYNIVITVLKIH
jgi:hypothetical protein|tara:strand:+ start:791 stop:985 length:195 start_codon:yes stop_codon:yes gene_type:complete